MCRVAADQRDDDPGSEERRLGAPALLGEIPPAQPRQENTQQGRQQRADPVHGKERNSPVTVGEARADAAQRDGEVCAGCF